MKRTARLLLLFLVVLSVVVYLTPGDAGLVPEFAPVGESPQVPPILPSSKVNMPLAEVAGDDAKAPFAYEKYIPEPAWPVVRLF